MNKVSTSKKVIGFTLIGITLAAMILPAFHVITYGTGIWVILLVRFIALFI